MKKFSQFPVCGFHVDLRIQVMTMDALKRLVETLAGFGINTLVMEWEATFPYEKHSIISNHVCYTRSQIKSFISHCKGLGIDVIPLQQCFGHVEYILRHYRYAHLREDKKDICQICPLKESEASVLFTELFRDIANLHPSRYFHVGGDETYLLGHCEKCASKADKKGKSKLFVDYMKMICEIVIRMGKQPVLWADIILSYPEAVSELPKETVFVDWNYGWEIDHFGSIKHLLDKGCTFWGAPSLRSSPDDFYVSCWEQHLNNIRDYIPYCRRAGYTGIVMTSWSTSGIYGLEWGQGFEPIQMFPIRRVYPLAGFRILIAAYTEAMHQTAPLDPAAFVKAYAQKRFGLGKAQAACFWNVLRTNPTPVREGNSLTGGSILGILKEVRQAQKRLKTLKPVKHKNEFSHFLLMMDIREWYLSFKEIEVFTQSQEFTSYHRKRITRSLKKLLKKGMALNKRFSRQIKGFLYSQEIKKENQNRNRKVRLLFERLSGRST
jgi:hypothetical protein